MSLIDGLQWRYATKRMTGEKVSEEKLSAILAATQLSASSYGLQPYTILVISNPELKAKLQPAAYGQPQIVESSHLLVFCAWTKITTAEIDAYIDDVTAKRHQAAGANDGFKAYIQSAVTGLIEEQQQIWAAKQAYIALGTALAAAAEQQVDATPMEGFMPAQFDEIIGLKEKGLTTAVIMALGYRSPDDGLSKAPKVRRDTDKLFQFIN